MTATMRCSTPADDWAWLACQEPGCRFSCPVDQADRLWSHCGVAHRRVPSVGERTPLAPNPAPVPVGLSGLGALYIEVGRRRVDAGGRVWCCVMGDHYGLTRHQGGWWYGRLQGDTFPARFLTEIEPAAAAGLEEWDAATCPADTDPTPSHGIRLAAAAAGGGA